MDRNSSYTSLNPVIDQFNDSSSYTSMIYLYSLGILPYSFNFIQTKFLSGSTSILQSIFPHSSPHIRNPDSLSIHTTSNHESPTSSIQTQPDEDDTVDMDDVTILMTRLGLSPTSLDDTESSTMTTPKLLSRRELSRIFDEREPSLDEVKAAFDVFDQNSDGFIDAIELGRVLCLLGLHREGSDIEVCKRMISGVDEDGDGMIGFNEFLMFMQKSFC